MENSVETQLSNTEKKSELVMPSYLDYRYYKVGRVPKTFKGKLISLKEYIDDDWSHLDRKDITQLLKYLNLEGRTVSGVFNTKFSRQDRHVLQVNTIDEKTSELSHILLAIFSKKPIWQDMLELTYDTKGFFEKRILVYDEDSDLHEKDEDLYDFCLIEEFAVINNMCGVDTFLLAAKGIMHDGSREGLSYHFTRYLMPDSKPETIKYILPSREEMIEIDDVEDLDRLMAVL